MPATAPAALEAAPVPLGRARWALMAQFVIFGMIMASWTSRMPSIREALDVSALQLGSLLIVGGAGSLCGALSVGAITARIGHRRALLLGAAGNVVGFGLLAASVFAGRVELFLAGAAINGFCGALVNVPINVNAAAVERGLGRTVLPHFHAAFSIGAAGGAVIAAGFAWASIAVGWQMIVVVALLTAARLALLVPATALTSAAAVAAGARASGRRALRTALSAWAEPRTVLLGVVLLASSLAEGTANNWLALAVTDGFAAAESTAALAFGSFVAAMTLFRFIGTGLIDRFGRVAVLRASGAASMLGTALFVVAPALPLAWIGIVLWGCGAALGAPIAISAASDDPAKAGERVAVVTSFITIGSLAAPPLLGLLIDAAGARPAMLVVGAFALVSFAVAGQARRRAPEPAAAPVPV